LGLATLLEDPSAVEFRQNAQRGASVLTCRLSVQLTDRRQIPGPERTEQPVRRWIGLDIEMPGFKLMVGRHLAEP
jgi:hypothetical protein